MTQSLKLGGAGQDAAPKIRRLNRIPIIVALVLVVAFLAAVIYGLSSRGLHFGGAPDAGPVSGEPAANDAERLKQGIDDAIIGEPAPAPPQPLTPPKKADAGNPFQPHPKTKAESEQPAAPALEPEGVWRARLRREQEEQYLREIHRQHMASLQADEAALGSPIAVSLGRLEPGQNAGRSSGQRQEYGPTNPPSSALDLYVAAAKVGLGGQGIDPNGQPGKQMFLNRNFTDSGYLPNGVVPQRSPFELKRGSVIPATLITGIDSDLPGRLIAQVSQNVFDSATGRHLLIPQGAKLFGRYDSKISFGQSRLLVVWTDIVFPNGSTLRIGGMAGTDAAGEGGFHDEVDNHYLKTFGSAVLVALIGAGTDMLLPSDRNALNSTSAEDAARRSFAETFGQMTRQTVSRNLNVQPTLEIRPGYIFNVLIDKDIVFPEPYH